MRQKVKHRKRKNHLGSMILASQDALWKEYFRDEGHLSDFVNGTLFEGKQKLSPISVILNQNTDMSTAIPNGDLYLSLNRYRDVLASCYVDNISFLIGIENESSIKNDEVLKIWLYDWCKYFIDYQNKNKMIPVITIVLSTSLNRWTKPRSLYDMVDVPECLKEFANNFTIEVYRLFELDENLFYNKDNKDLIRLSKLLKKKGKDLSKDPFVGVSKSVIVLSSIVTGLKKEVVECLLNERNGGEFEMFEAVERSNMKFRNEGIFIGQSKNIVKLLPAFIGNEPSVSIKEIISQSTRDKLDRLTDELVAGNIKSETDVLNFLIKDKKEDFD
ncbi:MAG: hypothetical protein LUG12_06300 [Erysipelotrichaceae bacterium]|nr:hypothetical protein [Erysipelotrichaceae bacterium]